MMMDDRLIDGDHDYDARHGDLGLPLLAPEHRIVILMHRNKVHRLAMTCSPLHHEVLLRSDLSISTLLLKLYIIIYY